MKLTQLFVISLAFTLGFATASEAEKDYSDFTGTAWANGLFENEDGEMEGWYDINKKSNIDGDADDNMCYAASAVNLIAWWQNGEYGKNLTSSAPKKLNDIWNTYVSAATSAGEEMWEEGGESLSAINWWISGIYSPNLDNEKELARYYEDASVLGPQSLPPVTLPGMTGFNGHNGYYYDEYGLTQQDLAAFMESEVWSYGEPFEINFAEMLEDDAGISLTISAGSEGDLHVITLWGAEYEDGELVSLWLTDSDDYYLSENPEARLFEVEVELTTGEKGDQILFKNYYAGDGYYIDSVYVMNASASANWRLVPEPTTTTLSLLALAGLAARRRRRK